MGLNLSSTTLQLCDLEQVIFLSESLVFSLKWLCTYSSFRGNQGAWEGRYFEEMKRGKAGLRTVGYLQGME